MLDDGVVSCKHVAFGFTGLMEWCGLLWCPNQLFGLSFWRHPFTAEDPMLSKWWNATFLKICSDEETNESAFWMDGLRMSPLSVINITFSDKLFWINSIFNYYFIIITYCSNTYPIFCMLPPIAQKIYFIFPRGHIHFPLLFVEKNPLILFKISSCFVGYLSLVTLYWS